MEKSGKNVNWNRQIHVKIRTTQNHLRIINFVYWMYYMLVMPSSHFYVSFPQANH